MPKRRGRQESSYTRNGADQERGSSNTGHLEFMSSPHGVGTSRLAYRCRVHDGCYRGYTEGSYCVFKVFKPEAMYASMGDVDQKDVDMQRTARRLAEQFCSACAMRTHQGGRALRRHHSRW
jgi:hypothetical protein